MKKTVIAIITIIALAAFTGCDPALSTASLGKDESPVITAPADDDPKAPSITDDGSGNAPVVPADDAEDDIPVYRPETPAEEPDGAAPETDGKAPAEDADTSPSDGIYRPSSPITGI